MLLAVTAATVASEQAMFDGISTSFKIALAILIGVIIGAHTPVRDIFGLRTREAEPKNIKEIILAPVRRVSSCVSAGDRLSWVWEDYNLQEDTMFPMQGTVIFDEEGKVVLIEGDDGLLYSPLCFTMAQIEKIERCADLEFKFKGGEHNA